MSESTVIRRLRAELAEKDKQLERFVAYEGGPWSEPECSFAEFERAMLACIAKTVGCLTPRHIGLKTCLSCGAIQSHDGSLPCGH